ncbi:NAD(P)H-dependent oxidoreductase [Mucilaginibacter jinjuensis]|uniref:NAD(P)H-dependent oxidoreductase n=1 Tax=Mucilaginibacter jinjuensis TaxID=1176721 RepID=A0ABY7T866_9SPHI|nr:NAD(P)H-dependent oxidoreductase [Mucilaginibacter jinjuensis]WCT12454.1 NAD(P)H-dependent oxidoreductase [Mucilaginibacter jinjuensis]
MNILIVYAHPEPQSLNGAMYRTAIEHLTKLGHQVKTTDLYAMQFDPVSDRKNFATVSNPDYFKQQAEELYANEHNGFSAEIAAEQEKVEWCNLMIFQFPLWWFALPAILKGWVDRVFAMGRFYNNGRIYDNGVFKGKKAMLSLTTGGPEKNYNKDLYGEMESILKPIHRGIFEFTGWTVLRPQVVYAVERQSVEELAGELEMWKDRLEGVFEEV